MKALRVAIGALLLVLAAAVVAGLVWTRERKEEQATEERAPRPDSGSQAGAQGAQGAQGASGGAAAVAQPGASGGPRRRRLVDTRPLLAARRLASFATSQEELELVRQAERHADHAVDLAFAEAMRDATENPPELTPEMRARAERRANARIDLEAAEQRVRELERRVGAAAREAQRVPLQHQLEVANAQLELVRDELDEATESLQRAGGDPQVRIKRLREVYDAAQKEPRPSPTAPPTANDASSLLVRWRAWRWQRAKLDEIVRARAEVQERVQRMTARRASIAAQIQKEDAEREAAKRAAAGLTAGEAAQASPEATQASVATLKKFSDTQRRLAISGRRLQDFRDLGETYVAWEAIVEGHARAALHLLLKGVLGVLAVLVVAFVALGIVDRIFHGIARERLRMGTLRTVVRFGVQALAALVVVFAILGVPDQVTTIVGLAGAGLTVAMKDFIVAFFGWFVLMGRNGIRVGDWVEIKGVGGEVAEISLFHTVLLETGSWTDAGHPTGRRVSFVNSFAIEGHYFNFTTSGQWMWDELRLLVPQGEDPYPVIDGVQRLVERETEENAKQAEHEWRQSTSRYRVQTFSAVPGLNVIPTGAGIELAVRYITRAHERHATRKRLYEAVVAFLHGRRAEPRGAGAA